MNLDRATVTLLIAIIGGLFVGLTYVKQSIFLGVIGLVTMVLLWWLHREWVP